ncbi:hypothetical protein HK101_007165, partial [Irineochytrium annulatum]
MASTGPQRPRSPAPHPLFPAEKYHQHLPPTYHPHHPHPYHHHEAPNVPRTGPFPSVSAILHSPEPYGGPSAGGTARPRLNIDTSTRQLPLPYPTQRSASYYTPAGGSAEGGSYGSRMAAVDRASIRIQEILASPASDGPWERRENPFERKEEQHASGKKEEGIR